MFDAKTIRLAESLRPDLDFSVLGTEEFAILKIVENARGGGVVPVYDADISNGIASFSGVTKSKPLVSLKLNIPVTQQGSGTPSPDNIRDFIGFSGVTITRNNGVDTGDTYLISFGQTVYSAILDVLTGKLYLTHEIKTIDENSGIDMLNEIVVLDNFFDIDEDSITDSVNCNCYQRGANRSNTSNTMAYNPDYSFCCKNGGYATRIMIKDTRFTTIEDYKTWLSTNPVKIAVKLSEPIEIDISPTIINTLIGDNVIFADVADVTECKYTKK